MVMSDITLNNFANCFMEISANFYPISESFLIRAFYSAPRGEGDADFKICGPATQKNYGNATAAPPEPGRNFGPAFGGAQYSKQNKNKL